jgi:O-methyltransferase involved in polyketide biosynthesis
LCCIEVDLPATQQRKRRAAGADGQGVHYLGADLAQRPLGTVLAACPSFHAGLSTLFVAEGLLMYVPLPAVAALFAQMAAAAPHSQVAFTWFEPQADGRPNFRDRSRLIDLWLALRGEPFVSGMARADLPGFLHGAGYALERVMESADLLGEGQRAALPVAGEYICFARSRGAADTYYSFAGAVDKE